MSPAAVRPACEGCRSLRFSYAAALHSYTKSVQELDAVAPGPDFPEAYKRAVESRCAFEAARVALERHLVEHRSSGTEFSDD